MSVRMNVPGACVATCVAIFICFVGAFLWAVQHGDDRLDFYDSCKVGKAFPEEFQADAIVKYGQYSILYSWGYTPFSETAVTPTEIHDLHELPFVYDAMQFMIAPDGRLVAKAWCGETIHVLTEDGAVKGSSLDLLKNWGVK